MCYPTCFVGVRLFAGVRGKRKGRGRMVGEVRGNEAREEEDELWKEGGRKRRKEERKVGGVEMKEGRKESGRGERRKE